MFSHLVGVLGVYQVPVHLFVCVESYLVSKTCDDPYQHMCTTPQVSAIHRYLKEFFNKYHSANRQFWTMFNVFALYLVLPCPYSPIPMYGHLLGVGGG
mmetsp:Transcript_130483/g.225630  ORF Transcript_130483/g.225630 Transcript_130483/m.225630 type:complete len:98 (+) Transcript_130483:982-1275(+)